MPDSRFEEILKNLGSDDTNEHNEKLKELDTLTTLEDITELLIAALNANTKTNVLDEIWGFIEKQGGLNTLRGVTDNETLLHQAIFVKNEALINEIFRHEKNISIINAIDNQNKTPLFLALYLDNINIVTKLLEKGALITADDEARYQSKMAFIRAILTIATDYNDALEKNMTLDGQQFINDIEILCNGAQTNGVPIACSDGVIKQLKTMSQNGNPINELIQTVLNTFNAIQADNEKIEKRLLIYNKNKTITFENFQIPISELENIEIMGSGAYGEILQCQYTGTNAEFQKRCLKNPSTNQYWFAVKWPIGNPEEFKKEQDIVNELSHDFKTTSGKPSYNLAYGATIEEQPLILLQLEGYRFNAKQKPESASAEKFFTLAAKNIGTHLDPAATDEQKAFYHACKDDIDVTMLNIMDSMYHSIQTIHEKGILHLDVSLRNCLINVERDKDGNPILPITFNANMCDFGYALKIDPTTKTISDQRKVAPLKWIDHNRCCKQPLCVTTDLYSFRVAFFEMIAADLSIDLTNILSLPNPKKLPHDINIAMQIAAQGDKFVLEAYVKNVYALLDNNTLNEEARNRVRIFIDCFKEYLINPQQPTTTAEIVAASEADKESLHKAYGNFFIESILSKLDKVDTNNPSEIIQLLISIKRLMQLPTPSPLSDHEMHLRNECNRLLNNPYDNAVNVINEIKDIAVNIKLNNIPEKLKKLSANYDAIKNKAIALNNQKSVIPSNFNEFNYNNPESIQKSLKDIQAEILSLKESEVKKNQLTSYLNTIKSRIESDNFIWATLKEQKIKSLQVELNKRVQEYSKLTKEKHHDEKSFGKALGLQKTINSLLDELINEGDQTRSELKNNLEDDYQKIWKPLGQQEVNKNIKSIWEYSNKPHDENDPIIKFTRSLTALVKYACQDMPTNRLDDNINKKISQINEFLKVDSLKILSKQDVTKAGKEAIALREVIENEISQCGNLITYLSSFKKNIESNKEIGLSLLLSKSATHGAIDQDVDTIKRTLLLASSGSVDTIRSKLEKLMLTQERINRFIDLNNKIKSNESLTEALKTKIHKVAQIALKKSLDKSETQQANHIQMMLDKLLSKSGPEEMVNYLDDEMHAIEKIGDKELNSILVELKLLLEEKQEQNEKEEAPSRDLLAAKLRNIKLKMDKDHDPCHIELQKLLADEKTRKIILGNTHLKKEYQKLYEQSADMLANSLIAVDKALICNLNCDEFTHITSSKQPKPTLNAAADFFNKIYSFVYDDIIKRNSIDERTLAMEHWIRVAEKCLNHTELKDLNMAMAIGSALQSSPLYRLKATKEGLSEHAKEALKEIEFVSSSQASYKNLRDYLEKNTNAIPYIGLYRTDCTFIIDGNKDENVRTKLINEKKTPIEQRIQRIQKIEFSHPPVKLPQEKPLSENDAYTQSKKLEPKDTEITPSSLLSNKIYLPQAKIQKIEQPSIKEKEATSEDPLTKTLTAEIGKYKEPEGKERENLDGILENPNVQKELYGKTTPRESTPKTAREAFIKELIRILNEDENDLVLTDKNLDPLDHVTTMQQLLGKKGLSLYKAAIEEEQKDPNFRDAVFAKSLKHYDGPTWKQRIILWVGGPSASGKSYATQAVIKEVGEIFSKGGNIEESQKGNNVVSVDGGIEREVSQMRQLVLQVALAKGYPGIKDLQKNTDLGIKKYVKKAALATNDISLAIPNTFTNPFTKFKIRAYSKLEKTKQIFSQVVEQEGNEEDFKKTVIRMGVSRAYKSDFGKPDKTKVKMNNFEIPCESKKYQSKYFKRGKSESDDAKNTYLKTEKDPLYLKITSDLIFVRYDDKIHQWVKCKDDWKGNTQKLTQRAFKAWQEEEKNTDQEKRETRLPEWLKTIRGNDELTKSLIEEPKGRARSHRVATGEKASDIHVHAPIEIKDEQKIYIEKKIGEDGLKNLEQSLKYDSTKAFQYDGEVWKTYLTSHPSSDVEREKKGIVNRLFYALAGPNLKIRTPENNQFESINETNLTLGALLSHGGRALIQIPPLGKDNKNPDQFFEWIMGGKQHIAKFARTFATHAVKVTDGSVEETRPKFSLTKPGAGVQLLKDFVKHRHYGLNVGLGTNQRSMEANGENGHVYMYWQPPTKNKPGALLVGCENSAPGCTDKFGQAHTAKAVSGNISPTGTRKYRGFEDKNKLPRALGGVKIELNNTQLHNLMETKQEKINTITDELSTQVNKLPSLLLNEEQQSEKEKQAVTDAYLTRQKHYAERGEYSLLFTNSLLQQFAKNGQIKFQSNNIEDIIQAINEINRTTEELILDNNKAAKKLQSILDEFLVNSPSAEQTKELAEINKQVFYHHLILNPSLADMLLDTRLKSTEPIRFSTLDLIKNINRTILNPEYDDPKKLITLLKHIGVDAKPNQIQQIIASNQRLRIEMKNRNIESNEEKKAWLKQNKQKYSSTQLIYLPQEPYKSDLKIAVSQKMVKPTPSFKGKVEVELSQTIKTAREAKAMIPLLTRRIRKDQPSAQLLDSIKNNMKYFEKQKYPSPPYHYQTATIAFEGPKTAVYVRYNGTELTDEHLEQMRKHTLSIRKLSLIGGILTGMDSSDAYLTNDNDKRNSIKNELVYFANEVANNVADIDTWINQLVDAIHQILPQLKREAIIKQISKAERYFVADYTSNQVVINETTINNQSTIQMDIPYGNVLTENQKKDFISIHHEPPAGLFKKLATWERDWLRKKIPESVTGDWSRFESLSQPSTMSQIPGMQNARMNYLLTASNQKDYSLVSRSFKTGTMVPYEIPDSDRAAATKQTAEQELNHLKNQAISSYNSVWGAILPDLKPLVFVQSLLSDAFIGTSEADYVALQRKAINEIKANYKDIEIVFGNDPINFQRWITAQSGLVSEVLGHWDHTNKIINHADNLIEQLKGKSLNQEQQYKSSLIEAARAELLQLRDAKKLPQFNRNFAAFKAAYTAILVESMGGIVATNCKSGKDRTGITELYCHAMLLYFEKYGKLPSYSDTEEDHKKFTAPYQKLFNSMKIQEAASMNAPGSFGIKDSQVLKGSTIGDVLGKTRLISTKIASLNKPKAFRPATPLQNILKMSKQTVPTTREIHSPTPIEPVVTPPTMLPTAQKKPSFWNSFFKQSESKIDESAIRQVLEHTKKSFELLTLQHKNVSSLDETTSLNLMNDYKQLRTLQDKAKGPLAREIFELGEKIKDFKDMHAKILQSIQDKELIASTKEQP